MPRSRVIVGSKIIEISWEDPKLRKRCSTDKDGKRAFGQDQWRVLKRRLISIEAADTLADLQGVPGRFHELTVDRAGQFSLDLRGGVRLMFAPDHDPVPVAAAGGIDRTAVTKVTILEVVDHHGR